MFSQQLQLLGVFSSRELNNNSRTRSLNRSLKLTLPSRLCCDPGNKVQWALGTCGLCLEATATACYGLQQTDRTPKNYMRQIHVIEGRALAVVD